MERISFSKRQFQKSTRKINERNDWLYRSSQKLKKPISQIGKLLEDWDTAGIRGLYLASESLEKETGQPFGKFWWWQVKEVRKSLVDN